VLDERQYTFFVIILQKPKAFFVGGGCSENDTPPRGSEWTLKRLGDKYNCSRFRDERIFRVHANWH
jgi:hypothetical protein